MLLERLFHFLTGHATFQIEGDHARFLNLAARSGLTLWGFTKGEQGCAVSCRAREYRRTRPIARRCGVKLRCVKKGGAPFFVRRLWLRKGLVAGIALGAGLLWFLQGFVWNVAVSGTDSLGDRLILEAAEKAGVSVGASRKRIDPKLAAHAILNERPELRWAAVNTDGCFMEIVVEEADRKPAFTDAGKWSNIVASRAGTVKSIEAESGRPEVALGDTVEEGDLLIAGLYREKLDPWDPRAEHPLETAGPARGRVIGETYREFTVQASALKRETAPTGKRRVDRTLIVFGFRLPLGLHTKASGPVSVYREECSLTALGVTLPLSLEKTEYVFLETRAKTLTKAELQDAALRKLREAQKAEIAPGGKVIKEELTWAFPDGMCVLSAKCRCEEEIGATREILVTSPKDDENF